MKQLKINIVRNFLITGGFYGIYYAAFQFLAVLWRRFFVQDRVFSGYIGRFSVWFLWEIPLWIFCLVSGYFLPFVIESEHKYTWSIILGCIFVLNSILFNHIYDVKAQNLFDFATRLINIISPIAFCAVGTFLNKRK